MKIKKINFADILNKKKNIGIIAVAVMIGAAALVSNVTANKIPLHDGDVLVDSQNVEVEQDGTNASTIEEAKADLELKRNDCIAKYDETIKNTTNEDERKDAMDKKSQLMQYMEQEIACEELIKAKKLPESLVIMTQNRITVTCFTDELKQDQASKICSIIMEETKYTADKIVIQSND